MFPSTIHPLLLGATLLLLTCTVLDAQQPQTTPTPAQPSIGNVSSSVSSTLQSLFSPRFRQPLEIKILPVNSNVFFNSPNAANSTATGGGRTISGPLRLPASFLQQQPKIFILKDGQLIDGNSVLTTNGVAQAVAPLVSNLPAAAGLPESSFRRQPVFTQRVPAPAPAPQPAPAPAPLPQSTLPSRRTRIENNTLLLENPFADTPYQSNNEMINSLIAGLFGNFTFKLQSLPPSELLFGELPTANRTVTRTFVERIFSEDQGVSNQLESVPEGEQPTPEKELPTLEEELPTLEAPPTPPLAPVTESPEEAPQEFPLPEDTGNEPETEPDVNQLNSHLASFGDVIRNDEDSSSSLLNGDSDELPADISFTRPNLGLPQEEDFTTTESPLARETDAPSPVTPESPTVNHQFEFNRLEGVSTVASWPASPSVNSINHGVSHLRPPPPQQRSPLFRTAIFPSYFPTSRQFQSSPPQQRPPPPTLKPITAPSINFPPPPRPTIRQSPIIIRPTPQPQVAPLIHPLSSPLSSAIVSPLLQAEETPPTEAPQPPVTTLPNFSPAVVPYKLNSITRKVSKPRFSSSHLRFPSIKQHYNFELNNKKIVSVGGGSSSSSGSVSASGPSKSSAHSFRQNILQLQNSLNLGTRLVPKLSNSYSPQHVAAATLKGGGQRRAEAAAYRTTSSLPSQKQNDKRTNFETNGSPSSSSGSLSSLFASRPEIEGDLVNIISLPHYKFYLGKKT